MTPEKPMIYCTRSILAHQAGEKTQTRRLINPLSPGNSWIPWQDEVHGVWYWRHSKDMLRGRLVAMRQPYAPGTICWIREGLKRSESGIVVYQADGTPAWFEGVETKQWSRSLDAVQQPALLWAWKRSKLTAMFMPRWACRYCVKILAVRPEGLQDIGDRDVVAEGTLNAMPNIPITRYDGQYRDWYAEYWESLHKKPGTRWDDSPWVWVYSVAPQLP